MLLVMAGCDVVYGLGGRASDAREATAYRQRITIAPPTSEQLDDVPVAITIPMEHRARLAGVTPLGREVAFFDESGEPLEGEVEQLSQPDGALVAWVRLPHLAGDTAIDMEYGGDRLLPRRNPSMWNATYGAVWHFSPDETDAALDATSNENTLTTSTTTAPPTVPGLVGGARSFDGVTTMEAADDDSLDPASGSFTVSLWMHKPTNIGPFDMPLFKGGSSIGFDGYDFELGTSAWRGCVVGGPSKDCAFIDGSDLQGAWVFLALVIDRTTPATLTMFVNGSPRSTVPLTVGPINGTRPLTLSIAGTPYSGILDEIRVYHGVRSAGWITTEQFNLNNPTSFLTFGEPVAIE